VYFENAKYAQAYRMMRRTRKKHWSVCVCCTLREALYHSFRWIWSPVLLAEHVRCQGVKLSAW